MSKLLSETWRWNNLYKIRSENGLEFIKQRSDQIELSNILYPAFKGNYKEQVVILKNRQRGTSTWCALFCLDCTAYNPAKVADTLADTRDRAGTIFDNVVKVAWDEIPKGLKPRADRDNVNELNFSAIRSKYIVSASKSEPVDILHISEAPYFQDEGKITEALQMVRRNGITIMESTAYGVGNLFEETFMNAWKAKQAGKYHHWKPLFFPWYTDPTNTVAVHPEMELQNAAFIEQLTAKIQEKGFKLSESQKHFYDQKLTDLGDEVYQFYPTEPEEAFLHSGRPVFDLVILSKLSDAHGRKPIRIDDGIEIFVEPNNDHTYGIGVDTAEGLQHGDNSSITVICKETGEEAAQCTGKYAPEQLSYKLGQVCRMYDTSVNRTRHLAMVERNNHGHAVIAYAKEDRAINLYQREDKDKITEKQSLVIGWDTNERSKALAISTLRKDMASGQCIPHSHETYDELRTYVHAERGIMGAMTGKKDDRVISLALSNMACHEMLTVGSLSLSDYNFY